MQDKLIEEMAKALWVSWGGVLESPGWETFAKTELGENYRKGCLAVLAAVRAHDAPETEPWWEKEWAESFKKYREYAAQHGCPLGGDLLEFVLQDALAYRASHAAESTAQLDAEEPAEPVEDVVSRMCELMGGCACEHCIKRMTAALAVAREGYYSQKQVEQSIADVWSSSENGLLLPFLERFRARLAPKPSLAEEMEPILTKHFKTIGVVDCAAELAALVERRTK